MGRPRAGVDINVEKAMTRVICQEVFLASGLTMAQLETVFSIGTVDAFGKKTSKTFSRYCELDPAKSRAAPRDVLQTIIRMALDRGWLTRSKIEAWGVQRVLMLDHHHASEMFERRKSERDELVRTLRELRAVAKKAYELNSISRSARATLFPESAQVWNIHEYIRNSPEFIQEDSEDCPISKLPEFVAPVDLNGVLKLLEVCLEQTRVHFKDGLKLVPAPDLQRLALPVKRKSKASHTDFSDIDELLDMIEKSMT